MPGAVSIHTKGSNMPNLTSPVMLSEKEGLRCGSLAAQDLMQRRSSWLAGAQQQASELLQHLEGILQFEYARCAHWHTWHHLQQAALSLSPILSVSPSLACFLSPSALPGLGSLSSNAHSWPRRCSASASGVSTLPAVSSPDQAGTITR